MLHQMDFFQTILPQLLFLALGLLIGFALGNRNARAVSASVEAAKRIESELRTRNLELEQALEKLRLALSQEQTLRAAAEANCAAAEKRLVEVRADHERSLAELCGTREKALAELRDAFSALSQKALQEARPEFLRLATDAFEKLAETAKGDLQTRQEAIAGIVRPLREALAAYEARMQSAEQKHFETLGAVSKQLELLQTQNLLLANETNQLRKILHSNQARGRWGEMTLRRVVEAVGMSPHCDFTEQATAGDARPDLLIHLPGNRLILVDAKVPDIDFLTSLPSADDTARAEILGTHAAKLRATILSLARRDYPRQFPGALDHVVLFLPAESLLATALEADPDLLLNAATQKILLATPSSLIAILQAAALSWRQDAQNRNAQEIGEAGRELLERIQRFIAHFEAIREGIIRTSRAFDQAVGSYESRVRPGAERLARLAGAPQGAFTPEITPTQIVPRSVNDLKAEHPHQTPQSPEV